MNVNPTHLFQLCFVISIAGLIVWIVCNWLKALPLGVLGVLAQLALPIGWIAVWYQTYQGQVDFPIWYAVAGTGFMLAPVLFQVFESVYNTSFQPAGGVYQVGADNRMVGTPGRTFDPGLWVGLFGPIILTNVFAALVLFATRYA